MSLERRKNNNRNVIFLSLLAFKCQREMQQINREQRQTSARLLRQLPANIIRNTTLPFDQQNVNKNFQSSATNRLDKSVNQQLQTEFDTQRSLSSCPTYSSLSRQSAVAVDTHVRKGKKT